MNSIEYLKAMIIADFEALAPEDREECMEEIRALLLKTAAEAEWR